MNAAVVVRRYQPADLEQVRWLHDRTPPAGSVATLPQGWFREIDDIPASFDAFWVAVELGLEEDAIVGTVGVERVGTKPVTLPLPDFLRLASPSLRLHSMRVAPERQRPGIGRLLTQTAIDWAREQGYESLILDTTVQQEPAIELYRSLGFRVVGNTRLGRYDLVWLALDLRARALEAGSSQEALA
jgi:ribosomal protein S18 acetylase RimI-like enzyme